MESSRKRKRDDRTLPIEDVAVPKYLASQSAAASHLVSKEEHELDLKERSGQWSELLSSPTWKVSEPVGGRMIHAEPIFAGEERYILIAYDRWIGVYSASTSLIIRKLPASPEKPQEATITACTLSAINPNRLYVSTSRGHVYHWDWVAREQLDCWDIQAHIYGLATCSLAIGDRTVDVVYTVEKRDRKTYIAAYDFVRGQQYSGKDRAQLFGLGKPITNLHVTPSGENIIASYGHQLLIGATKSQNIPAVGKLEFVWRELSTPEVITCIDVRETVIREWSRDKVNASKPKRSTSRPLLDVVVGGLKGAIYVHENLISKLDQKGRKDRSTAAVNLTPVKLHWHREAVATLKWSLDGNYVISGGAETVLVLWQLDTGKQQFLPHLSSAIESLVVSPTGKSYAVRLADNSTVILSTAELMPRANVAGIQTRYFRPALPSRVCVQTVDTIEMQQSRAVEQGLLRTPSAINPLNPTHVLLAVPSSQPFAIASGAYANATHLQTFDYRLGRQIARQALTRTNTTTVNVGPEANKIGEPNVNLMRISHDGHWLATVDEWIPPQRDLDYLVTTKSGITDEQHGRREVFLKMWAWDTERQQWELSTRIDEAHLHVDGHGGASRVLDLAASPTKVQFATVGERGDVRIWAPKTRLRNGVVVRGRNAEGLTTWGCQYLLRLDSSPRLPASSHISSVATNVCGRAFLEYSTDGSVLAASHQQSIEPDLKCLHFLDPELGQVKSTRAEVFSGDLIAMGFVGRYLIVVSDSIVVWDIVLEKLHFGLSLQPTRLTPQHRSTMTHIAVNHSNQTFALSLPFVQKGDPYKASLHNWHKYNSTIMVFDPTEPLPLHTASLSQAVTSLLPLESAKGYLALNSRGEILILTPMGTPIASLSEAIINLAEPELSGEMPLGNNELEKDAERGGAHLKTNHDVHDNHVEDDNPRVRSTRSSLTPEPVEYGPTEEEEDETPVVRQEQIAGIFDTGPAFAMPPMEELFNLVAGLFARKAVPA